MQVTVIRIFDNKLSVRFDDKEVCLLPNKSVCNEHDIERTMNKIVTEVLESLDRLDSCEDTCKQFDKNW